MRRLATDNEQPNRVKTEAAEFMSEFEMVGFCFDHGVNQSKKSRVFPEPRIRII
jgi:hypothetical protein